MNKPRSTRILTGFAFALITSGLLAAPAPTAPKTSARHSLWKVEGPSATVYLLGSVHFLQKTNYPLAQPIEAAFDQAKKVVFEIDLAEMETIAVQQKLMGKAMLPAGQSIQDHLTAETYQELTNHVEEAGLPMILIQQLQPGMAAIMLTMMELQRIGLDPQWGVDQHFYKRAKKEGKEISALETVDFQIDMITGFAGKEGELLMKSTLKDIKKARTKFGEMVQAWQTGNNEDLETLLNEALREAPAVYDRLLVARNKAWIPAIEKLVRGKENAIVIVGAGHLVGKQGVVDLLEKKGLTVVQQ